MIKTLIDIIYPVRCPVCQEVATPKGQKICPECRKKIKFIKEPRCKRCSKPINSHEAEFCFDCSKKTFSYEKGMALCVYDKIMKTSITNFKYNNRREFADFYVDEIVDRFEREIMQINPDALIPIPIHSSKLKKRGFNQAELLAEKIGKRLNIPVYSHILLRNRKTEAQKELNEKQRLKNLENAFIFCKNGVELNKVILIDDIYTTGSTIEVCTKLLNNNNISYVYFICISIGNGF